MKLFLTDADNLDSRYAPSMISIRKNHHIKNMLYKNDI